MNVHFQPKSAYLRGNLDLDAKMLWYRNFMKIVKFQILTQNHKFEQGITMVWWKVWKGIIPHRECSQNINERDAKTFQRGRIFL